MGLAATRPKPKRPDEPKDVERPDRIILERLQKDDKVSLGDLAKKTGLASSSVHCRIKRLEEEGIIKGYHAIVDPVKLGYDILAVSFIRSRYDPKSYERLSKALPKIPGIWGLLPDGRYGLRRPDPREEPVRPQPDCLRVDLDEGHRAVRHPHRDRATQGRHRGPDGLGVRRPSPHPSPARTVGSAG